MEIYCDTYDVLMKLVNAVMSVSIEYWMKMIQQEKFFKKKFPMFLLSVV